MTDPPASSVTSSASPEVGERDWDAVMDDAVRVLTEAARLRRPVLQQNGTGSSQPSVSATEPSDWAEFVALAVAGAAANVGGTEQALAGRPGSWEADAVRSLLAGTVGVDDEHLLVHRREPLVITVDVEQILADAGVEARYSRAASVLDAQDRQRHAERADRVSGLCWTYERDATGGWVCPDPEAPTFTVQAWRADCAADGMTAAQIARAEEWITDPQGVGYRLVIAKDDTARTQLLELERAQDEEPDLVEALERQRLGEYAGYAEALTATILAAAAQRYPHLPVRVQVTSHGDDEVDGTDPWDVAQPGPALLAAAIAVTLLPGQAPAPEVDVPGQPVRHLDRDTGPSPRRRVGPQAGESR